MIGLTSIISSITPVETPRSNPPKIVSKDFLTSLDITFRYEKEENEGLLRAMEKGRKSALLNADKKETVFKEAKILTLIAKRANSFY